MLESRSCVFLCLFVFGELVVMGRLKVMMPGGVVVSGSSEVMLTRSHLQSSSVRRHGARNEPNPVPGWQLPVGCRFIDHCGQVFCQ